MVHFETEVLLYLLLFFCFVLLFFVLFCFVFLYKMEWNCLPVTKSALLNIKEKKCTEELH